jgi:Zn-dependent M28 family amino/carboxypeptidase
MRLLLLTVPCAIATIAGAQTRADSAQTKQTITAADLMRHVSVLAHDSMEGRAVGAPGNAKARTYLLQALREAGLTQLGAGYEQRFTARGRDTASRQGVNIVGVVRGVATPQRYIVVTAHYDHVGIRQGQVFNGADDNASGAGALVEITRMLKASPPSNSVIIVAFDAEESGELGAKAFLANPPVPTTQMIMNVNLDMVGRNARNELYAAGTTPFPFLRPYLDSIATRSSITLKLGHDDPAGPRQDNWTTQSDHSAFNDKRIPWIYFGVEDHPDYHRATDDVERLMPEFYAGAVNTVLDAIRTFDRNLATIIANAGAHQ